MLDWSLYPSFSESELKCKHTGKCEMNPLFMEWLQAVRNQFNRPMIITSGYRDVTHPIEAAKESRGAHTYGCAVDVAVRGTEALRLIALAYSMGCRRIGVNQKGNGRFIHLDMADQYAQLPKACWSY